MTLSISSETEKMLREELARGRFSSADEVVRAGLAMLEWATEGQGNIPVEEHRQLRAQINEGLKDIARGDTLDFNLDAIWTEAERLDKDREKKAI
jgi:putative addiction module CopG family antidote